MKNLKFNRRTFMVSLMGAGIGLISIRYMKNYAEVRWAETELEKLHIDIDRVGFSIACAIVTSKRRALLSMTRVPVALEFDQVMMDGYVVNRRELDEARGLIVDSNK